jgi:chromosome segregation ATPase
MDKLFEPPPEGGPGAVKVSVFFRAVMALLAGAVIGLAAANVYLFMQVNRLATDQTRSREATLAEIAKLREASAAAVEANRRNLETMREELVETGRQQNSKAVAAARSARSEALNRADQVAKTLTEEQQRQQRQVASEISEVKQATSETAAKIGEVSTHVGVVRSEVAATRSELEKTISDLKRVRGDMGVISGLIATNSNELAALKALGERNYLEFNIKRGKQFQKIGDIAVKLNKTDPRKNQFTIELVVQDKKIEKKDRNINEPLQFYVAQGRPPYEVVVNEVKKDLIVGYLATPKGSP